MVIPVGIVIALGIVALVITARKGLGITPSEYQLLGWLGCMAPIQLQAFLPLSATVSTVIVSSGLGATVLFVHDLVCLLRSPDHPLGSGQNR